MIASAQILQCEVYVTIVLLSLYRILSSISDPVIWEEMELGAITNAIQNLDLLFCHKEVICLHSLQIYHQLSLTFNFSAYCWVEIKYYCILRSKKTLKPRFNITLCLLQMWALVEIVWIQNCVMMEGKRSCPDANKNILSRHQFPL